MGRRRRRKLLSGRLRIHGPLIISLLLLLLLLLLMLHRVGLTVELLLLRVVVIVKRRRVCAHGGVLERNTRGALNDHGRGLLTVGRGTGENGLKV